MNDITPDLISQIATRLYNEIPAANMVPKTETDLRASRRCPEFPTGVSSASVASLRRDFSAERRTDCPAERRRPSCRAERPNQRRPTD